MKAVLAIIALGAIVWGFALIGMLSVAQGIGPAPVPTEEPLISPAAREGHAGIVGLAEFPRASPAEYRHDVYGSEVVTELEYLVDSGTREVRRHFRDALERLGWSVTETGWVRGEWTFALRQGARHGTLEIEGRDGMTEVEIEIAEPVSSRGGLTDR